jgi:superfamily II DNA or RNA helicase
MKLTIDSILRIEDAPEGLLEQIKAELTIRNPDFDKKRRMRLNRWAWGQEYIKMWREEGEAVILPRGYYARLWELTGGCCIQDNRLILPQVDYPKQPELRDYQAPALKLARDWQQGVAVAPCGSGKTVTGDGIIADIGQPTLWITHTMDLLKQSMDSAVKFLGLKGDQIGIIQGANMSVGSHITFATVQTLSKRDLTTIKNKFGCIVVDECHLVVKDADKARMFESVISQFPAYYRFGLTASEHRADGLIETMFHVMGPKFYEVAQDDSRLSIMTPRVVFIETGFIYEQPVDEDGERAMLSVQQMYKAMQEDFDRQLTMQRILGLRIYEGDCCLVLGDSLAYLGMMFSAMRKSGVAAEFINGETPKRVREHIMNGMRGGKYQFLFATYALAKLGLDIPRLNKLVLATPHRDKTSVQQAVGRIMRPFDGKQQPIVYDIYDSKVPQLVNWARERVRVYKRLGCLVEGGPVVRKW